MLSPYAASKCLVVVCCQVHAYTACPNNQTAYLAELKSGKEVLVVDGKGRQRSAIIGRVKIETRPLVSSLAALWLVSAMPTCLCKACTPDFESCTCTVHQDVHAPGRTPCAMSLTQAFFCNLISICNLELPICRWHCSSVICLSSACLRQSENAICCANRCLWKLRLKTVSDTA